MKNVLFTLITLLGIIVANFFATKSFALQQPVANTATASTEDKDAANQTPREVEVTIDNFKFSPEKLTVKAGTTVVFTNKDDVPHTIVAEADTFRSKAVDTDEKFSYRFATPGTYAYFCSLHPKMTGTIMVQ